MPKRAHELGACYARALVKSPVWNQTCYDKNLFWSKHCMIQCRNFDFFIAILLLVSSWSLPGPHNSGRPPNSWGHKLTSYSRYKNFGNWVDAAEDQRLWESHLKFHQLLPALSGNFLYILKFISFSRLFGVQARLDSTRVDTALLIADRLVNRALAWKPLPAYH